MRFTRRQIVLGAGGLVLFGACADGDDGLRDLLAGFEPQEAAFAAAFRDMASEEVIVFGAEVLRTAPESVAHSRQMCQTTDFEAACTADAEEGRVIQVGGWWLPETMAGVAGAITILFGS